LGLLLLRVVVGATVVVHGWTAIHDVPPSMSAWAATVVAIGLGVAVTVGFITDVAAVLLSIGTIGVVCGWNPWSGADPAERISTVFVVSMCVAVALLGPGALSVDARLRGRREIVIPEKH
jgi:uncharacterized membrane protein YphA (DoxX/SURF4 family)